MATKNKGEDKKRTTIPDAVLHIIWILIISVAIAIVGNELFRGSNMSNMLILIFISAYIIFSFAKKYWTEDRSKNIMEMTDMILTLVGGLLLATISTVSQSIDTTGYALARNIFGDIESQPHIIVLYLGMLLLIVGVIRIYMINRTRQRLKN
jgi:purine-cytosine permease-like protein